MIGSCCQKRRKGGPCQEEGFPRRILIFYFHSGYANVPFVPGLNLLGGESAESHKDQISLSLSFPSFWHGDLLTKPLFCPGRSAMALRLAPRCLTQTPALRMGQVLPACTYARHASTVTAVSSSRLPADVRSQIYVPSQILWSKLPQTHTCAAPSFDPESRSSVRLCHHCVPQSMCPVHGTDLRPSASYVCSWGGLPSV